MSVDELKDFVVSMRELRVFQGLTIHAKVDKVYNARVFMVLNDRMNSVEIAPVNFNLDDPKITVDWIASRLADEVAAAVKELFIKNVKGHQYNGDGAPVKVVTSLTSGEVVRV
jgi:hypothetical protein